MRKITILILSLSLLLLFAGCGGEKATTQAPSVAPDAAQSSETVTAETSQLDGERYSADKFSITVPEGWEVMDVDGGVQLYKMSGEIIEVHFRGENQGEGHAKQQVEFIASQYSGTTPEEVELLDKKFWTTSYTASSVEQSSYLRMEDGVMLSIKCAGANHQSDPEFTAILNSIVFD